MSDWISVKDRLPKLFEDVLTYDDDVGIRINWLEELVDEVAYFAYGGKYVTHWTYLPEPPNESDADFEKNYPNGYVNGGKMIYGEDEDDD